MSARLTYNPHGVRDRRQTRAHELVAAALNPLLNALKKWWEESNKRLDEAGDDNDKKREVYRNVLKGIILIVFTLIFIPTVWAGMAWGGLETKLGGLQAASEATQVGHHVSAAFTRAMVFEGCEVEQLVKRAAVVGPLAGLDSTKRCLDAFKYIKDQPKEKIEGVVVKAIYKGKGQVPDNIIANVVNKVVTEGVEPFQTSVNAVSVRLARHFEKIQIPESVGQQIYKALLQPVFQAISTGHFDTAEKKAEEMMGIFAEELYKKLNSSRKLTEKRFTEIAKRNEIILRNTLTSATTTSALVVAVFMGGFLAYRKWRAQWDERRHEAMEFRRLNFNINSKRKNRRKSKRKSRSRLRRGRSPRKSKRKSKRKSRKKSKRKSRRKNKRKSRRKNKRKSRRKSKRKNKRKSQRKSKRKSKRKRK